jgi:NAD(P)-dependent dehydrogenase (short-subunit alcohol dehydrogenase family)
MTSPLAGKVVVITGSTRGIGRAIAEGCAAGGADVVVSSRSDEAVARTVHELAEAGFRSSGVACDVRRSDDIEALAEHALDTWGAIDVWVNNAGVSEGYRPVDELTPDDVAEIVDINLAGTALGSIVALRHFREHGGVLVNLAGRGYRGEATPHTALYAATKAAIASLTRSLAAENRDRPDVHVHALVPGMVATDFYRDVKTSPRLEATGGNVDLALHAFGVPLDAVGREAAAFLAGPAWRSTGTIENLLKGWRRVRGIALIAWYGMSGRMKRDH